MICLERLCDNLDGLILELVGMHEILGRNDTTRRTVLGINAVSERQESQ